MALSINEIKTRAIQFSKEWENTFSEEAEAQPFLIAFFNVFGVYNRKFATFEQRIQKLDGSDGYIDLLWKQNILIEMKSKGKDLEKAYQQAQEYLPNLKQHEIPKYILVCDFEIFHLYDLANNNTKYEFVLKDFVHNIHYFLPLIGYTKTTFKEQDIANIKAAELMGNLHDKLKEIGYIGHDLEVYLVRILFCLFAEDTTIFNKQQFQDYIEQRTNEDGSNLGGLIQHLFEVLNTPTEKRLKVLDEQLAEFPYINGSLFSEPLRMASFDTKMRQVLLNCCYFDWSTISPAIFGAMFQSIMNPKERREIGAHYTSETNILKLIKPLFLDTLWEEFESIKNNKGKTKQTKLEEFQKKISNLKFLDPACGCGNFLIIAYRELRLLELEIVKELYKKQQVIDIHKIILMNVNQFYGIEIEEFPARIAEVAIWLVDHQMNMIVSSNFGQYFKRIPLTKQATIVHGNALRINWHDVLPITECSYILGNPPFIGKQYQSNEQKEDLTLIYCNNLKMGVLDYVTAWFYKAASYIQNTLIKVAFVTTNSIAQGEQVGILWDILFTQYKIKIHFSYHNFKWNNEARNKAQVYVVIIGFAHFDIITKKIFEYDESQGIHIECNVKNINPYLVEGDDIVITKKRKPICHVPSIIFGSMPNDNGYLLFTEAEKIDFLQKEPKSEQYFRPIVSAKEFLNNQKRWCLWLYDANPRDLINLIEIQKRIKLVKQHRLDSDRKSTQKLANIPSLFGEIRQPTQNYIVIPRVSSGGRNYIPMGILNDFTIVSDSCLYICSDNNLYYLGILQSSIHMTWVKYVCGYLGTSFRYSNEIVYNNFPFPKNITDKQIKTIEDRIQKILDIRLKFSDNSLADLYHNLSMPKVLLKAHQDLDKVVDEAYRNKKQPFTSDLERISFLFTLYEQYTANLFTEEKTKKRKK